MNPLTCISCEHYRRDGCAELGPDVDGYPHIPLTACSWAIYLPGSDQREDES
jgi:hypothetical protein